MPTYEYKCPKCGTEFEAFQKITAKPGAKCPRCSAKATRQMSAGAGLVFKGSGFYLTDYGRSGQKARNDGDASSGTEKAAEAKPAESKSAADKPAAKPASEKPAVSKPKKKDD